MAASRVGPRGLPQIPRHLRLRTLRGRTGGSRQRGGNPRATNRAPRSVLATAPAQPGLLRVSTQFGVRTPRPHLTCRRRRARCPNSDNPPNAFRPHLHPRTSYPNSPRLPKPAHHLLGRPSATSDCFTRVAFEGGRAGRRGAMMVVRLSQRCGTRAVPGTGAGRDLAAPDDPGVGLSLPDGVRRGR